MAAGAEAGSHRRSFGAEKDPAVTGNSLARGAVQTTIDSQFPIATKADLPAKDQPAQVFIINCRMPDHRRILSPRCRQIARRRLAPDQRLLAGRAPGIAAKPAALTDHPVAGNQHGDRVGSDGTRHRARGGRPADGGSNITIAGQRPGRNAQQRLPHLDLERRAAKMQADRPTPDQSPDRAASAPS